MTDPNGTDAHVDPDKDDNEPVESTNGQDEIDKPRPL
jgi:hypothetical protein